MVFSCGAQDILASDDDDSVVDVPQGYEEIATSSDGACEDI
jgi:hypothetical protein